MKIKPIKTKYKGIEFRSKLEAQWAVFFDQCGVDWEYEPEGFDLGDGVWYLPDFVLHNVPVGYVDDNFDIRWKLSKGLDPIDELSKRKVIKNLWVEVKGVLDSYSAQKVNKFNSLLDKDSSIIMVGKFPSNNYLDELYDQLWDDSKFDCYYNQFGAEWTGYTVYLGADVTGTIGAYSDCDRYTRAGIDCDKTDEAYEFARNYQFIHRKDKGIE